MNKEFAMELLTHTDHTALSPVLTEEGLLLLLDEGLRYHTASVCIPPSYLTKALEYTKGELPLCTVIGFPLGYATKETKLFEAEDALNKGAAEIDMVINQGFLKDKRYTEVEEEISAMKKLAGEKVLKVIIETSNLTDAEKKEMCRIVSHAGADYIKTSTGFSAEGAKKEDILLFRENLDPCVRIKASGGIRTVEDMTELYKAGADRLGMSKAVALLKAYVDENGV